MESDRSPHPPKAQLWLGKLLGLLSSVRLGMVLIGLIIAYLSVCSIANAPLRRLLDATESGVFGAWPGLVLWGGLCVNVTLATLWRIPLTPARFGAWMAHVGVLLLGLGSIFYVTGRIEGTLVLRPMESANAFDDSDVRALRVEALTPAGPVAPTQTPLWDLPRNVPAEDLSIPVNSPLPDCRLRVVRYHPHATGRLTWRDDGPVESPGAEVTVRVGPDPMRMSERTLRFAPDWRFQGEQLFDDILFRYEPGLTDEQIAELAAPAPPTHVLDVRTPTGAQRTASLTVGQVWRPESIPWSFRLDWAGPAWGQGREPVAIVTVFREGELPESDPRRPRLFWRRLVAGRPEQTRDILDPNLPEPDAPQPLWPGLELAYEFNDSPAGQRDAVIITGHREGGPRAIWLSQTGARAVFDLTGGPVELFRRAGFYGVPPGEMAIVELQWVRAMDRAFPQTVIEPDEADEPWIGPMVEVEIEGDGFRYRQGVAMLARPNRDVADFVVPDGRKCYIELTPMRNPLPATIQLVGAEFDRYPGTNIARDYISHVVVTQPGREPLRASISLNQPLTVGPFRISQNSWDMRNPDSPEFVAFGVSTQPGLEYIWAGCILLGVSMPYAFYVKPILVRRRRRRLDRKPAGEAGP